MKQLVNKPVTVVVPVYKDWNSLMLCLESLKLYLSTEHKVIIINDMSNEHEYLENNILQSISNEKNFEYYRNPCNMGFVKTCNRAVFELDKTNNDILLLNSDTQVTNGFLEEMLSVLYITEKHGVVCPRSNNATLLSIPINYSKNRKEIIEKSYKCFKSVKDKMPRYSVIPTAVGFCMLIKRDVVKNFLLFDEEYGLGYNEENDFCMRINQYGYSSIMANRAFVYHFESKSFGEKKKNEQDEKNSRLLLERYPYYLRLIDNYFSKEIHPIDYFADLIDDSFYNKKKILFSLYNLPPHFNGTAEYGLSLLREFYDLYNHKYDISILVGRDADDFHKLSGKFPKVQYNDSISGTFHLAIIPSQIFHLDHLFLLNRHCLKYVFTMQDIITLRCQYLLKDNMVLKDIFAMSMKYADGMISISNYSKNDVCSYMQPEIKLIEEQKVKVIYHGLKQFNITHNIEFSIPFDNYILVIGNNYKHKAIERIIGQLKENSNNFIVIGYGNNGFLSSNIYGYKSGFLQESFIDFLYSNCRMVLFPSVYEGFGLPILESIAYQKKIILKDNELNKELCENFPEAKNGFFFFENFDELGLTILLAEKSSAYRENYVGRTWKDVAVETEEFVSDVLKNEVNNSELIKRWKDLTYLETCSFQYMTESSLRGEMLLQNFKAFIKCRHPKIFYFLKKLKRIF